MTIPGTQMKKMMITIFSATMFFVMPCYAASATESKMPMSKSEAKIAAGKTAKLVQSYTWYDGERERRVWLNPNILAEFNPEANGNSAIKSANATARVIETKHSQKSMRLWQVDNAAETAVNKLRASHPKGNYSEVLHDGPTGSGGMRALPGNVIVYLNPKWSEEEVKNWLSTRKLVMVKKLEIGPNIYLLKSGPGLESLAIANKLYRSGEVLAAFPDWWEEVAIR